MNEKGKTNYLVVVIGNCTMTRTHVRDYLAEHPRMMGVLFTLALLAAQAAPVAANAQAYTNGP